MTESLGDYRGFSGLKIHYPTKIDEKFAKSCIGKPVKDENGEIIGEIVDVILIDDKTASITAKFNCKEQDRIRQNF